MSTLDAPREFPYACFTAILLFAVSMDSALGAIAAATGTGIWPLLAAAAPGILIAAGFVAGILLSMQGGYIAAVKSTEVGT